MNLDARAEKIRYIQIAEERLRRQSRRKILNYYPDTGRLRRELYVKHLGYFEAGARYRERLFLSANRVGKTEGVGLYELTLHLTGQYPDWWVGRRFGRAITAWAAGDTGKTVREILQSKLLGPLESMGTGLIPGDAIERVTRSSGVADAVDTIFVKHSSGGVSSCTLKSYDQRRESFQGTERDVILLDEEPPLDVYTECLLRTMTNNGMLMLTFTPLMGVSEVVMAFLPGGKLDGDNEVAPGKYVCTATWDDAPHLSEEVKKELWDAIPPFQRDARSKGVPQLGSGAIYPVPESEFTVDDFDIPGHWRKAYALDVGWNRTAALWAAQDPETRTWYCYSEHYQGKVEPSVHAESVMARGTRIPGVIDPAARGRGQSDGTQLMQQYLDLGLDLTPADNSREAGINEVWQALVGGRLKVFKSLTNFLSEFRLYRRDDKGQIVKVNDHLMDCLHPDTLVITSQGRRRIVDLVGEEGLVLTVGGKWAPFSDCRQTRTNSDMVDLTFSDGQRVSCTPDHKVLTPAGWVRAKDMLGRFGYNAISQAIAGNTWNMPSFPTQNRNSGASHTGSAVITSSATGSGYTGLFGKRITAKFQRACASIILTATGAITPLITWLSWPLIPICRTICGCVRLMDSQRTPYWRLQSGTALSAVSNGTGSISRTLGMSCSGKGHFRASNAALSLLHKIMGMFGSAGTDARAHTDERRVLMTSIRRATCAGQSLVTANTGRPGSAGDLVRCVSVSESQPSDTYCMAVEGTHAFAVADGLIVHNCLRYLMMSGIHVAAAGARDFRIEWLKFYPQHNVSGDNVYILVSPAGRKRNQPEQTETGVMVIALSEDGRFYLLDAFRDKLSLVERTKLVFALHRKYRPLAVVYDEYGYDSDRQHLRDEMDGQKYHFEIKEAKDGSLKIEDRIRRLTSTFERRLMWLPEKLIKDRSDGKQADMIDLFIEQEYLLFPTGSNRIMLDCMSRLFDIDLSWPAGKYGEHAVVNPFPEWAYDL